MSTRITLTTFVWLCLIQQSSGQPPKRGDTRPAKEMIEKFEAAARPLRSILPNRFPETRLSSWRERDINELEDTPISTARFVSTLDKDIIGRVFRSSGTVSGDQREPLNFGPAIVLSPMQREWRYYLTQEEKRLYGKKTGLITRQSTKKFESDDDRERDKLIELNCYRRKREVEQPLIHINRVDFAKLELAHGMTVDVEFTVRDLFFDDTDSSEKIRISRVLADVRVLRIDGSASQASTSADDIDYTAPTDSAPLPVLLLSKRLVFLIDFSGSAIVTHHAISKVIDEAIESLGPDQRFNAIVFYGVKNGTERAVTEKFDPGFVNTNPDTKGKFSTWLERQSPSGQTEPLAPFMAALRQEPDSVLFLSDGLFDKSVIEDITKANNGAVAINCLVFDEAILSDRSGLPRLTDGARRMQTLASKNKGKTKIVTGSDLQTR